MKVYTKRGDDGTTGLLFGGRVRKDSERPTAYGSVDEAQATLGVVRAELDADDELVPIIIPVMRDLWVVMGELATLPENHPKLEDGVSRVTPGMVESVENHIDDVSSRFEMPAEFVVPGENRVAALLDVSRTVVRRAERASVAAIAENSLAGVYLNRLSDLLWVLARWREGTPTAVRDVR